MTEQAEFSEQDRRWMKQALRLAARGRGQTAPNPCVGAVLVRGDRLLGQGYHRRAGTDHAEIVAFKDAAKRSPAATKHSPSRPGRRVAAGPAAGATLYVTLEPCSHQGRTPPCADAVIAAGVRHVVAASRDPNPRVAGQGLARMAAAGLRVEVGLLRDEAIALNEDFMHYHLTGRPLVTCKWAMTLDGQTAAWSGDSQWISGEASRRYVHQLRSRHDAILAGVGTTLTDNPSLNVRLPGYRGRQPIRLVADGALRSPLTARCVTAQPGGPTWFLATRAAPAELVRRYEQAGCRVLIVPGRRQILDMAATIMLLGREGIRSIFVEGGPTLHASLIRDRLCDKMVAFIAPKVIGMPAHYRRSSIYGWGRALMSEAIALHNVRIRPFGDDVCVEGDYRDWEERFGHV